MAHKQAEYTLATYCHNRSHNHCRTGGDHIQDDVCIFISQALEKGAVYPHLLITINNAAIPLGGFSWQP